MQEAKSVQFAYDIGERVVVLPLQSPGSVTMLSWDGISCRYRVRYFYEGYVRYEDFVETELGIDSGDCHRFTAISAEANT